MDHTLQKIISESQKEKSRPSQNMCVTIGDKEYYNITQEHVQKQDKE